MPWVCPEPVLNLIQESDSGEVVASRNDILKQNWGNVVNQALDI